MLKQAEKRLREWCFTINNWTQDEWNICANVKCKYIVFGEEVGELEGTPHLQGYVYFEHGKTRGATCKALGGRARVSARYPDSTPEFASDYCKKLNKYFEKGELPHQGKRSDIDEIREFLQTTPKMRQVVNVAKSYQAVKLAECWLKYWEPIRSWEPKVEWFWGATGTGKTRKAHEIMEDPYVAKKGKWWEGYDAHANVILDDFREDWYTFDDFLKLLDRYEYRVECKGSSRQMLARHIIITAPQHPRDMFTSPFMTEDINQLLRRIDNIVKFEKK